MNPESKRVCKRALVNHREPGPCSTSNIIYIEQLDRRKTALNKQKRSISTLSLVCAKHMCTHVHTCTLMHAHIYIHTCLHTHKFTRTNSHIRTPTLIYTPKLTLSKTLSQAHWHTSPTLLSSFCADCTNHIRISHIPLCNGLDLSALNYPCFVSLTKLLCSRNHFSESLRVPNGPGN